MKKITLLLVLFCIVAFSAMSQTQLEKGKLFLGVTSTIALGGSEGSELFGFGFITEKYKYGSGPAEAEYKQFVYNILPKAGYFIIDNLVAGLEVVVTGNKWTDIDDDDAYKESTLGIGPFVRYYYPLEKIYPFAEVEAIFGSCRESWIDEVDKDPMFMFGINLGASLPLGDRVTFDGSLGYSRTTYSWEDEEASVDNKDIFGGIGFRFGFSVYLPVK